MKERLTELEITVAHQEDTIEALNDEVIRQGRVIDRLGKRLEALERALKSAVEDDRPSPEEEPPPPHY